MTIDEMMHQNLKFGNYSNTFIYTLFIMTDIHSHHPENKEVIETGDNRFISKLQEKFWKNLWFEDENEAKSFIAKSKAFYNSVKDAHRGQIRKTWEWYFENHIHGVIDIILTFPDTTLRDVIVALGHDFVEDHREQLSYEQACNHILTTFWTKWWWPLVNSIKRLTKQDVEYYLDPQITRLLQWMNENEKRDFLQKNKEEFGLLRWEIYFSGLEHDWTDWDIRVKTADSIHNLMSCHKLWEDKIRKTLFEKEKYLLPIVKKRSMTHEIQALERAISFTKLILLNDNISNETILLLLKEKN